MVGQANLQNQNIDISLVTSSVPPTSNMRISTCLLFLIFATSSCVEEEPGVMGKIKAGFEIAGKFLGLDQTSNLAQMVSQTFSGKALKKAAGDTQGNANIFSGFLRLLGLDSKKLSAIAVNAIIFVAQLISSTLSRPVPSQLAEARKLKDGTPLEWMLNNANVTDMLSDIKDTELPNNVVEYIKEMDLDEDTDCIQLLVCKSTPLIWGMQKAVNSTSEKAAKGRSALFANLPTMDEFAEYADSCEKKHPYCLIYY